MKEVETIPRESNPEVQTPASVLIGLFKTFGETVASVYLPHHW
jgi:hypothetical protein